jgi:hypothetical protein
MNMAGNGGFASNILTLDKDNRDRWSALMRSLFGAQDVLEIVQNGYDDLVANANDAQRATHREAKKKDCKPLFYMQQNVDAYHFEKINKCVKANEAWDILVSVSLYFRQALMNWREMMKPHLMCITAF